MMTAYAVEFTISLLALTGTAWVISECWARRDWTMVGFFLVFLVAPTWFAVAGFRTLALGEPDWLFNRTLSYAVRVPLVAALYVVAWCKRRERNGRWRDGGSR